ncbi:MAG: hypothetical protein IJG23_06315 [Clostridia bacterium]|nr:hypothetical protein [Clostridia bacterium]
MKKSTKKKYQNIKTDGQAYAELVSDYEREEMSDYSFKSGSQAMGKNEKKIRRLKIVRIVLSIIGAIFVLYLGYFIIALVKGVNSRETNTTEAYVIISEEESTTVPVSDESETSATVPQTTLPTETEADTAAQSTTKTEDSGL